MNWTELKIILWRLFIHLIWLTLFMTCYVPYTCHQIPIWKKNNVNWALSKQNKYTYKYNTNIHITNTWYQPMFLHYKNKVDINVVWVTKIQDKCGLMGSTITLVFLSASHQEGIIWKDDTLTKWLNLFDFVTPYQQLDDMFEQGCQSSHQFTLSVITIRLIVSRDLLKSSDY